MLPADIMFNVLNYLYTDDNPHACSEIEEHLSLDKEEAQEIYIDLKGEGFISTHETSEIIDVYIKPLGRKYVEKELSKFHNEIKINYDFAVLKFLYRENKLLTIDDFPENLKSFVPGVDRINDGSLSQALIKLKQFVDNTNVGQYIINETGKVHYENLVYKDNKKEKEFLETNNHGTVLQQRDFNGKVLQEPDLINETPMKNKKPGWPLLLGISAGIILIVLSVLKAVGKI